MANLFDASSLVAWAVGGFVTASLVEYWMHRLMHIYPKRFKFHIEHHRMNLGQGVLGEFWDYTKGGGIALMVLLLPFSWEIGLAWFVGALGYAAFAAFAHQVQHENPASCFWMKMPVHYVHHDHNQWNHNFGLGVDWWDRLFGTYLPVDWLGEKERELNTGSVWAVKWV